MSRLLGGYQVRRKIGQGAMAIVWQAYDPQRNIEVALKQPHYAQDVNNETRDDFEARFIREATMMLSINHPNIVSTYAVETVEGHPLIVMELLTGIPLNELIDSSKPELKNAVSIVAQLLEALHYAHMRGIIHRDVKPDNIFVAPGGLVKLTDFGVAHALGYSASHDGMVAGSPGYMSPEQMIGALPDARSDVFSAGIIFYELLTGANPFGASEGCSRDEVLLRTKSSELLPSLASQVGQPLWLVIETALKQNPQMRWSSALEMKNALIEAADGLVDYQVSQAVTTGGVDAIANMYPDSPFNGGDRIAGISRSVGRTALIAGGIVGAIALAVVLLSSSDLVGIGWVMIVAAMAAWVVWTTAKKKRSDYSTGFEDSSTSSLDHLPILTPWSVELSLTCVDSGAQSLIVSLPAQIGRDKSAAICVDDPRVSRVHACIEVKQGILVVEDLGSRNGTYVSGNLISQVTNVVVGDTILIGDSSIRIMKRMVWGND